MDIITFFLKPEVLIFDVIAPNSLGPCTSHYRYVYDKYVDFRFEFFTHNLNHEGYIKHQTLFQQIPSEILILLE